MESTSRESLGGEKMEATFSKRKYSKSKTKKAEKVTPGGILVIILLTFTCVNYFGAFHLDGFSII